MKTCATKNEYQIVVICLLDIVGYFRQGGQTKGEKMKKVQIIVSSGAETKYKT